MAEVEIGIGKSGRRAYGFDDIAIVPSRRTRDPEDVDITWEIDAFQFELPCSARRWTASSRPAPRSRSGRLGGVGVPQPRRTLDPLRRPRPAVRGDRHARRTRRRPGGCRSCTPSRSSPSSSASASSRSRTRASPLPPASPRSGSSSSRRWSSRPSSTSSSSRARSSRAEHVSSRAEPLNLKKFIRDLDVPVIVGGCASYSTALHLMRTGAVGVLVGVGPGQACTTRGVLGIGVPQATAIADAAGARMRHLDETGVVTCTSSPTAACAPVATSPRRSSAAPTRS